MQITGGLVADGTSFSLSIDMFVVTDMTNPGGTFFKTHLKPSTSERGKNARS